MIVPPLRDIVPIQRWKCEHPGCDTDATVSLRCGGPIGADLKLCDAHDFERFADFTPPSPRLVRPPTKASLAVGGALFLIGVAMAMVAIAIVAGCAAVGVPAPSLAAALWSNGLLVAAIGTVAFTILKLAERLLEARSR